MLASVAKGPQAAAIALSLCKKKKKMLDFITRSRDISQNCKLSADFMYLAQSTVCCSHREDSEALQFHKTY